MRQKVPMLKNKWLAIGLSVLAVVLIVYRVFFDKTTPMVPTQNNVPLLTQTTQGEIPSEEPEDAAVDPEWDNTGGDMMIDPESPLLLKRVTPSPEAALPYEPMVSQFGMGIFVKPQPAAVESQPAGEAPKVETFELNAIVIDEPRRFAIVNRQLVKAGDFVGGAEIIRIEPGQVIYRLNGVDLVLEAAVASVTRHQDGG